MRHWSRMLMLVGLLALPGIAYASHAALDAAGCCPGCSGKCNGHCSGCSHCPRSHK